jgi:hypothetical protein
MSKKSVILSVLASVVLVLFLASFGFMISRMLYQETPVSKETPKFEAPSCEDECDEDEDKIEFQTLDTCLSSEDMYPAVVVDIQIDEYYGKGKYYAVTTQNGILYYTKKKPKIGDTAMFVDDNHNIINCDMNK